MSQSKDNYNFELFFNALADRTRLRILNLIGDDEVCVCFFVEVLQINQPKISRHLAYLKRAGIVESRKEGLWMHYSIAGIDNEDVHKLLTDVRETISKDTEMQADRRRLVNVCCADKLPASVEGAPIPASLAKIQCEAKC